MQSWADFFREQATKPYWTELQAFIGRERAAGPVYPPEPLTYRAFELTPLSAVRVVILGQDPYHQPGQADGLSFSVRQGVKVPPSLRNVLIERLGDLFSIKRSHIPSAGGLGSSDLTPWTRQGVLLLNTALTVRQGEPGSHLAQWQPFTDEAVRAVVNSAEAAPHFVLWGSKAKATFERCVGRIVTGIRGLDLAGCTATRSSLVRLVTCTYSSHPSPLSADRGFFGSRPFSRANLALRLNNGEGCAVDWRLP